MDYEGYVWLKYRTTHIQGGCSSYDYTLVHPESIDFWEDNLIQENYNFGCDGVDYEIVDHPPIEVLSKMIDQNNIKIKNIREWNDYLVDLKWSLNDAK